MKSEFEICEIRAEFSEKTIPIERAKKLSVEELGDGYFDYFIVRGGVILLRFDEERVLIDGDGTVRVIVPEGTPKKTFDVFKRALNVVGRLTGSDVNEEIFEYSIILVMRLTTESDAEEAIKKCYKSEIIERLREISGNSVTPYIGLYLKDFGVREWKERVDINIEPLSLDTSRYWIRINLRLNNYKGIDGILEKINGYVENVTEIVRAIEVI